MNSGIDALFSTAERQQIRDAVDSAERDTAGEIVPYVVDRSDDYGDAIWKGATLGALGGSSIAAAFLAFVEIWGALPITWVLLPAPLGAALGVVLAASVPQVRRLLISQTILGRRVERRAAEAFLDEEVFRTRERTGILIFLSVFERRVVVMGDEGINSKVAKEEWQEIASELAAGIRRGRPVKALLQAIEDCGSLLQLRGVEIRADDTDELKDDLRLKDR